MFTHLRQALFGHVEVVTDDPLAELKGGPLSLGEVRAPRYVKTSASFSAGTPTFTPTAWRMSIQYGTP